MMLKIFRFSIVIIFGLLSSLVLSAQISISGQANCILPGIEYTYTVAGNWSSQDVPQMQWCAPGKIQANQSFCITGAMQIKVIYDASFANGDISLWTPSGSTTLNVSTGSAAFQDGQQLFPASQTAYTDTMPQSLRAYAPMGGNCEGIGFVYQWEIASDASGPFTAIAGADQLSYTPAAAAVEKTVYYRRKSIYNGTVVYSGTASVTYVREPVSAGQIYPANLSSYVPYGGTPSIGQTPGRGWECLQSNITYRWWYKSSPTGTPQLIGTGADQPANMPVVTTSDVIIYRETICGSTSVNSNELLFTTFPLNAGGIYTEDTVVVAGIKPTITQIVASGGRCTPASYQYQWQQSSDNIIWQNIGTGADYPIGAAFTTDMRIRRQVTCGTATAYSNVLVFKTFTENMLADNRSYVVANKVNLSGVTDTAAVNALMPIQKAKVTAFYDGLGRLSQKVSQQIGGSGKDIVELHDYDEYGREVNNYLAYGYSSTNTRDAASNGKYKVTGNTDQQDFYQSLFPGETAMGNAVYELSPLGRKLKQMQAGNSWAGSGRGKSISYSVNTTADQVRIWNIQPGTLNIPLSPASYGDGQLFKQVITDEQGSQVIEYRNKDRQLILRKLQLATGTALSVHHDGWLCTYYIYDDLGNLRCVIPPKAVELVKANWTISQQLINGLCYQYQYDNKQRLVIRKLPGVSAVAYVYDLRDRQVFMQDGNLAAAKQWQSTFYDENNRQIMTALYNKDITQVVLQAAMNTANGSSALSNTIPGDTKITVAWYDGRPVYQASQEIEFVNGFDSGGGATFESQLVPSSTVIAVTANNPLSGILATDLYPLTYSFYDDYSFVGAQAFQVSDMGKLESGDNPVSPEITSTASNQVRMAPTGSKVRILGTNKWLTTTNYYDNKTRMIQSISDNASGATDIVSKRYDFADRVLSTYQHHRNLRSGLVPEIKLLTVFNYDAADRVTSIKKKLNDETTYTTVAQHTFNDLGQLITKVQGASLNTEKMDYNVLGWLLGMNRQYVNNKEAGFFGYELAYDQPASVIAGVNYLSPQYNKNIAGIIWKGIGDRRKYDFSYDPAGRLMKADFLTNTGGSWNKTSLDYSVKMGDGINPLLAYDANGNILAMKQNGMKAGAPSALIDDLHYKYIDNSNQLKYVWDGSNDENSSLGDFREPAANNIANRTQELPDYAYDASGNMTSDKNKKIDSIIYNHLNLPEKITVNGTNTIEFQYNASGDKLKKTITDKTVNPALVTVTDYFSGLVYQNDTLLFIGHEEGRIRFIYKKGQTPLTAYDYFLRDHLGNVREVISDNTEVNTYLATMETTNAAKETALFSNVDNTRTPKPAGYPTDTAGNKYVAKLNAKAGGNKIGPSLVLRVMAGDTIHIKANAFYKSEGPVAKNGDAMPQEMITAIANAFGNTIVTQKVHEGVMASSFTPFSTNFTNEDYNRLKQKDPDAVQLNKPKAYLNFILFDDQFKMVDASSGIKSVKEEPDQLQTLMKDHLLIKENGYLYVYTSNESPTDVYFDNLMVTLASGHVLEETHYYPFGLTMAGISSKALKGANYPENKYRFNKGSELQNKEFGDGNGLEWYATPLRSLDPQLGRWWQIDSKPDYAQSLYSSMNNNPISFNDPLGDTVRIQFRTGFLGLGKRQEVIYNNGNLSNKDGSAYNGKVKGYLGQVVNALQSLNNTTEGKSMVSELQNSTNNFTIKNGSSNQFVASNTTASFGNIPSLQNITNGSLPSGGSGGIIYWNSSISTSGMNTAGTTDRPVYIGLGHEMAHARDANQGVLYIGSNYTNPLNGNSYQAQNLGLNKSEWRAVYFENIIRGQAGLPLRTNYGLQDNGGSYTGIGPAMLTPSGQPINYPIQ